jgi:hypothetical protein
MAICENCNQEMLLADSCKENQGRIPYGLETAWAEYNIKILPARCGDCNVKLGSIHHKDCDVEECSRCQKQLLSCNCSVK